MFSLVQRAQGCLMHALFYYMLPTLGRVSSLSSFFYTLILMPLVPWSLAEGLVCGNTVQGLEVATLGPEASAKGLTDSVHL